MEDLVNNLKGLNGRRVFVTGHTGFKGSWLLVILKALHCKVCGYALAPRKGEMFDLVGGENLCEHEVGDIRDYKNFEKAIIKFRPDIIFHLAAQPLVLASYNDPSETITTNYNGTLNLLEVLRNHELHIPTIIITTDKVYRNEEKQVSFKEDDPLGGKDIYSGSKAAVEILVSSYAASFGLKVVTARAGNVIGGGDYSEDRIVPDIFRAYRSKNHLTMRNPQAVRPWQHVLESLGGYLSYGNALSNNIELPRALNFGPSPNHFATVEHLVEQFNKCFRDYRVVTDSTLGANQKEAQFLTLDSHLAMKHLHWDPKWEMEETIKRTVDWYTTHEDKKLAITQEQVKIYFELN